MAHLNSAKFGSVLLLGGLLLSACHPVRGHGHIALINHPPYTKIVTRLICPDDEGDLQRVDMAADGRSCRYTGRHEEGVTLTLLDLNGQTPSDALQPMEASLKSALPVAGASGPSDSKSKTWTENSQGDDSDSDDDAGDGHDHDHDHDHDHTHIDLPGLHIDADGDKAHVHLPGVSIDADGDNAHVKTAFGGFSGATIEANGDGAVIRSGSAGTTGADLTYILASNKAGPDGVLAAGYIARGPASGPLVVASFKSKKSDRNGHNDRDDLSRLVNLNVGR